MEEIFSKAVKDEGSGLCLMYSILSCDDPLRTDMDYNRIYSLSITEYAGMLDYESVFVFDVTRIRERALEIARLMCENTVTPCTVYDILDDIL